MGCWIAVVSSHAHTLDAQERLADLLLCIISYCCVKRALAVLTETHSKFRMILGRWHVVVAAVREAIACRTQTTPLWHIGAALNDNDKDTADSPPVLIVTDKLRITQSVDATQAFHIICRVYYVFHRVTSSSHLLSIVGATLAGSLLATSS